MRFHVLSLPHTEATAEFSACAFTNKTRFFVTMMRSLGHDVFLYAGESTDTSPNEMITCICRTDRERLTGGAHYTQASFNNADEIWQIFNGNCIEALKKRLLPQDFICLMSGYAAKPVVDAFPGHISVEYGIGHAGSFCQFRVFESYAWMHTTYGAESNRNPAGIDPRWFDAVVPGYIDTDQFSLASKEDYYLFMGRTIDRKGIRIAADVCERAGRRLIIAGPGGWTGYGEYVGEIGPEMRNSLMSRARGFFCPTIYVEPFGNVAIEAQAAGTPVLCTDWGAFTETVLHGLTGYRCRTLSEFIQGIDNIEAGLVLPAVALRERIVNNYSLQATAPKYDRYFRRLSKLWRNGWYDVEDFDTSI